MESLADSFCAWVLQQAIADRHAQVLDADHLLFSLGSLEGHVVFLTQDARPLVELRVGRLGVCEAPFLTHFVLDDRWHARELFRDFAYALESETRNAVQRIVLCGAKDKHGLEFMSKLLEYQDQIPFRCTFEHKSIGELLGNLEPASAIMLTPDVHEHQRDLFLARGRTITFGLPAWVYESQDARAATRLLLEALGEPDLHSQEKSPDPARPLPRDGRVLALNVMYRDRSVRTGYRVYDNGRVRVRGAVTKPRIAMSDIDDLLKTLSVYGMPRDSIDAIGIMVPGVVNFCSMNLPSLGGRDNEIVEKLERAYGIPAFIDNNTNAAAMGCYYMDADHESLTLYRHQLGHKNGGQGTVLGGRLVVGRDGLAGEPKFYQRHFKYVDYEHGYAQAVWSEQGLSEIARNVLLATIGTVSPEASYLAIGAVNDVCAIACALERKLPKYCFPDLRVVHDYRERMYLGEVALCLDRIGKSASQGAVSQRDRSLDS